jgi:hypothetical protein
VSDPSPDHDACRLHCSLMDAQPLRRHRLGPHSVVLPVVSLLNLKGGESKEGPIGLP